MSLLPSRGPDTSTSQEGELQVVGVDDEVAPLLDALNSETARKILNEIYREPGTPSEVADRLEMSIQKVSYHIEKLEEQELIDVAGTQYSEKGQEMTVYQPPDEPTVLFVGTEERKRSLTTIVKRLLPVVTVLALGSLVIERLFGDGPAIGLGAQSASGAGGESGGGDSGGPEYSAENAEATETATETPSATATETATDGGDGIGIMEVTETPTDGASATPTEAPAATPTDAPVATETSTPRPETVQDATETPAGDTVNVALETTARATETASGAGLDLSPGLAFFLGGLSVLAVLGGWWVYTTYA